MPDAQIPHIDVAQVRLELAFIRGEMQGARAVSVKDARHALDTIETLLDYIEHYQAKGSNA